MIRRTGEETRLARWSRRKTQAREGAGAGAAKAKHGAAAPSPGAPPQGISSISTVPGAEGPAMPWAPPLAGPEDADGAPPAPGSAEIAPEDAAPEDPVTEADREKAAEMGLPDIDSLGDGSDFRPFMRKGVPDVLKRLALRKLWTSNPAFAVLDGLNDYDENFRVTNVLISAAESAYKAGKGYFTDTDEDKDEDETGDETADETADEPKQPPEPPDSPEPAPQAAAETEDESEDENSVGDAEDET